MDFVSCMRKSILRTFSCVLAMSDIMNDFIHESRSVSVRAGYNVSDTLGNNVVLRCFFSNSVLLLDVVEFDS